MLPSASVALALIVMFDGVKKAALLLGDVIEAVGAVLFAAATKTVMGLDVVVAFSLSVAFAVKIYVPTEGVFQV